MFETDENTDKPEQGLQEQISEITNVEVFDGKSLANVLTNLYSNILEDREITKQTVKDITEVIKGNSDSESYLKLKELELLKNSTDQLLKVADLMKNLLVAKSQPKAQSIAGLLVSESERLLLTEGENDNDDNNDEGENTKMIDTEFEELKEEETENFEEEFPEDEEILEGETADDEESDYDELIESLEKE